MLIAKVLLCAALASAGVHRLPRDVVEALSPGADKLITVVESDIDESSTDAPVTRLEVEEADAADTKVEDSPDTEDLEAVPEVVKTSPEDAAHLADGPPKFRAAEHVEQNLQTRLNLGSYWGGSDNLTFDGDMIGPTSAAKVTSESILWDTKDEYGPIINYYIYSTPVAPTTVRSALMHIEGRTCIRFQETGWGSMGARIKFVSGDGCSAYIGKRDFFYGQYVTVDKVCENKKDWAVVHQILHALGVPHQQTRSDRDDHILVTTGNAETAKKAFFDKNTNKLYSTTYDPLSVMQYGMFAHAKTADKPKATIITKDPLNQGLMTMPRVGLTFMDALMLNNMYGCPAIWQKKCSLAADYCKNLGYVGEQCSCVCPDGFSGVTCETKATISDYIPALRAKYTPLSGTLMAGTAAKKLEHIGTPARVLFTKVIERTAKTCVNIELTRVKFSLEARNTTSKLCEKEGLEVRLATTTTPGDWYCGTELTAATKLKSVGTSMVINYHRQAGLKSTGFEFTYKEEACPTTTTG